MTLTIPMIGLSLAALAGGIGAILSAYHPKGRPAFRILKPATTILIFAIVAVWFLAAEISYAGPIAVGLMFSLAGDVFLMMPARHFTSGIICFSFTHALYFLAFTYPSGIALLHLGTPLLALAAVGLVVLIWAGVARALRIPVSVYAVLITLMAAQALGSAFGTGSVASRIAAAGALSFYTSDAMLAIDRFRGRFAAAQGAVLSSYWLGQWLIAISVMVPG